MARTKIDVSLINPVTSPLNMDSNKITNLANGTVSTDAAAFGQIKVLQAGIQTISTTQTSSTSSTFTACTNQSVTITPTSSSNRIRIYVSTPLQCSSSATNASITIKRGTTELSGTTFGFARSDSQLVQSVSFTYIDSPATTSSTVYQVFVRSNDNSTAALCGRGDLASIITAEEIV